MDTSKIRVIFEYEFRRGTNAADAFGEGTANERTVRFWFKRFRDGNFDLKNEPRGRPSTQVNNNDLKEMVQAGPSQTTQELAAWFNVTLPTILTHLRQINKIKKYEIWVPHDLTDLQKETRVETCVALLNRYGNEGILDRIVTCDEKWILYDNRKTIDLGQGLGIRANPMRAGMWWQMGINRFDSVTTSLEQSRWGRSRQFQYNAV
ncbi:histone-lysine N-methyltransferase SETMAR-like [Maniola jurtina]|uniref:histone-lysine N-methyltransferase SETMAR-like n=1 Tax=Maniola jurtina TaxID=191418 RepID=UPI001E687FAD|nr:histone-lysine N-methyltransferase SETMAR-like [Maniola jurtina]